MVRGLGFGLLSGVVWAALEAITHWSAGSLIPPDAMGQMATLDVAVAAAAGLVVGLAFPQAGAATTALGVAGVYGLMRVGPGPKAELAFVPLAAGAAWLGGRLSGRDADGLLRYVHVAVLAALSLLLFEVYLNESHAAAPPKGIALLGLVAALPLAALALDRLLGLLVSSRGRRFALELAVGLAAAWFYARPLSATPFEDPVVTGVPPGAGAPDVILVTLDTTRADHLSTYGYPRETSPNLTAFAQDALLFEDAHSTVGWTLPSHASILTGLYPSHHGARSAGGAWLGGESIDGRRNVALPLGADKTTLAEVLRDRGYHTGAFVANFSYLYRAFGMAQGFQHYQDSPWMLLRLRPPIVRVMHAVRPQLWLRPYPKAHDIVASALAWFDTRSRERPTFLFVNFMDAHEPWLAPPPFDRWAKPLPNARLLATEELYTHEVRHFTDAQREFIVANYDGGIAAEDAALGDLIAALKARGRYDDALIIVVSDHGTLLGDHDQVGHIGRILYEPLLHVPLVVKFPGADHPRGRVATPVQTTDVFATAAHVAGAAVPAGTEGQVLPDVHHPILAEDEINAYLVWSVGEHYDRALRVLLDGNEKLITTSRGTRMLFDVGQDPGELHDLAPSEPARADAMEQQLKSLLPFDAPAPGASAERTRPTG